jgi:hypothetical protein
MNESAYGEFEGIGALFFVAVFFIVIILAAVSFLAPLWTQDQLVNITVIEKIPFHDGKYLIVAEINGREEVFTIGDEWILVTFNASDRYAFLKEGGQYQVDLCGYRVQPLSWYRNIWRIHGDHGIDY